MMPNIENLSDGPMIVMMIIALQIGRSSINQSESRIFGFQPIGGPGFAKNHELNTENISDDPMIAMMIIALRIGRSSINQS